MIEALDTAETWRRYRSASRYLMDGTLAVSPSAQWAVALFGAGSNASDLRNNVFADLTGEVDGSGHGYARGGASVNLEIAENDHGLMIVALDPVTWFPQSRPLAFEYAVLYLRDLVHRPNQPPLARPLLAVCRFPGGAVVRPDEGYASLDLREGVFVLAHDAQAEPANV
jgi:hypothetical protein